MRFYGSGSHAEKIGKWEGVEFFTPPNYAQIAQACGAWGELVEDPTTLSSAIRGALERVCGGQSAVLDVWLEK